ncbi:MAG TPA: ATP-binding protein, partial [Streptomyces sp.]|nr:ATP-binding protein [Streptomyces sp.]
AADDVSHLVAELLDNATSFSPPDAEVQLSGWMLENGEIMLSVQDEGIGMTGERLNELNVRLGEPDAQQPPGPDTGDGYAGLGNGLYVVARLAARHGLRVQLRRQRQGGIAAVAVLPRAILPDRPVPGALSGAPATAGGGAAAQSMPGSVAEANSNTLPSRHTSPASAAPDAPAQPGGPPPGPAPVPPAQPDTEPASAGPDAPGQADAPAPGGAGFEAAAPAESAAPEGREPGAPGTAQGDVDAAFGAAAPRVTDKGLPKRTPRHVAAQTDVPRPRKGGANAEELRRRLGGFQQGARDGHRDAAAETAGEGAQDEEARR